MLAARHPRGAHLFRIALTQRLEAICAPSVVQGLQRLQDSERVRFRSVLVYAGSSTIAPNAVVWGVRMASANSARLDVVHYLPFPATVEVSADQSRPGDATGTLEDAARCLKDAVSAARQIAEPTGRTDASTVNARVRSGTAISSLIQEVHDENPDLLVLALDDLLVSGERTAQILRHRQRRAGLSILLARKEAAAQCRRVTVCADFTPAGRFAARQAMHLAQSYGADVKFLCPCYMSSADVQYLAEIGEYRPELGRGCQTQADERLASWLRSLALDFRSIDLACPQVPNWDHRDGLACALENEDADLVILPLGRRRFFPGLRDNAFVRRIAPSVRGSLLILRQ